MHATPQNCIRPASIFLAAITEPHKLPRGRELTRASDGISPEHTEGIMYPKNCRVRSCKHHPTEIIYNWIDWAGVISLLNRSRAPLWASREILQGIHQGPVRMDGPGNGIGSLQSILGVQKSRFVGLFLTGLCVKGFQAPAIPPSIHSAAIGPRSTIILLAAVSGTRCKQGEVGNSTLIVRLSMAHRVTGFGFRRDRSKFKPEQVLIRDCGVSIF